METERTSRKRSEAKTMLEWLYIQHDPLLAARWSIIETFLLFYLMFMFIIWSLSILVNRIMKERANRIAINLGYDSFSELRFFLTRDSTFAACMFLMFVVVIYNFTHQMDVKANYQDAMLSSMYEKCAETGGYLLCSKGSEINFSTWLSNFSVNTSPIDYHTNSAHG